MNTFDLFLSLSIAIALPAYLGRELLDRYSDATGQSFVELLQADLFDPGFGLDFSPMSLINSLFAVALFSAASLLFLVVVLAVSLMVGT